MIPSVLTVFGLLALVLPFVSARHWSRHHQEVAHRARGDVNIFKRQSYSNARFTFYDVGLGACGQYNVASDWIVALNVEQYGGGYPGPNCFKSITIQYGGLTAQAVIMDECMGCPWGGLDFSRGLFDYFASESVGVLYGTWWFDGDSGGGGDQTSSTWTPPTSTTPWVQPTPTSTPDYTPTSSTPEYSPPATSSTPTYTSSPTTSTSPTTSSTSSVKSSTGLPSGLPVSTGMPPTSSTPNPQNLVHINQVMVEFGTILFAAIKDQ